MNQQNGEENNEKEMSEKCKMVEDETNSKKKVRRI